MEQGQLQLSIFLENAKWFAACVHKYFNQGLRLFYASSERIKEWAKRRDKHWCCLRGGAWNCLPLIHLRQRSVLMLILFCSYSHRIPFHHRASALRRARGKKKKMIKIHTYILRQKKKHHLGWFVYQRRGGWGAIISELPVPLWRFSSAFCRREILAARNKAGVLVFSKQNMLFDLCSLSLKTRCISVPGAATRSNCAGEINSSKDQNPPLPRCLSLSSSLAQCLHQWHKGRKRKLLIKHLHPMRQHRSDIG